MRDIRRELEETAELAERTKDQRLRRLGRPPKPRGEVGQVYSIRIPVDQIELLEKIAAREGRPPRTMLREWALERLQKETKRNREPKRISPKRPKRRSAPRRTV